MLPQSSAELFPVDGRRFDTLKGPIIASLVTIREADCFSDQVWFMLSLSNNKVLTIALSDAALRHDQNGQYRDQAFRLIEHWLKFGGPPKIEYFG